MCQDHVVVQQLVSILSTCWTYQQSPLPSGALTRHNVFLSYASNYIRPSAPECCGLLMPLRALRRDLKIYCVLSLWSISSAWGWDSSSGPHTHVSHRTKRRTWGAWEMNASASLIIYSKYATVTTVLNHTVTVERRQGNEMPCGSSHHSYSRSRVGQGFGRGLTWYHCCLKQRKGHSPRNTCYGMKRTSCRIS